jgi:hypothetical protein
VLEKPIPLDVGRGYTTVLLNVETPILTLGTDVGIDADGEKLPGRVVGTALIGMVTVEVSDSDAELIRHAAELKVSFVR